MPPESLSEILLGERVTVRHTLVDGRASDSVGRITARDRTTVTLQTRRGEVRIPLEAVLIHRVVQAVPWRIARFLRRAEVAVLDVDTALRHEEVTAPLLSELERGEVPIFLLPADPDSGATRLARGSLSWLVPHVLAAGEQQPRRDALAATHGEIEDRLGRVVGPGRVHFTDERSASIETAREWGWQARVFTPPD